MTTKETLIEQFTACYDENGWFVALKNAVKDLTAEQANWKTANLDNSIWEILTHLNFYNEAYLKRFKGIDYVYPTLENDETFSSAATEKEWRTEVERFDAIMSEWRNLLEAASESRFDEAVSATNKSLWSSVISNINTHNAHHAGQIVVIRKLQGSWDAKQGVS
ncbi:MAG: DinB family protein [Acidobacteriota bacterium]